MVLTTFLGIIASAHHRQHYQTEFFSTAGYCPISPFSSLCIPRMQTLCIIGIAAVMNDAAHDICTSALRSTWAALHADVQSQPVQHLYLMCRIQ